MAKRVFYSFHYKPDNWRAAMVRSMGALEGNQPTADNDWETIAKGGDEAIKKWINGQLDGKGCALVLIGSNTANRKWINYEIVKAWDEGKGVFGVYIHGLKDAEQKQSSKGSNPFDFITIGTGGPRLSTVVKAYDPPFTGSSEVYSHIKQNLASWVDAAVATRSAH